MTTIDVDVANGAFQVQKFTGNSDTEQVSYALEVANRLLRAHHFSASIAEYRRILAHHPLHPMALHNCSVALWKAGEHTEAARLMHSAMISEPCDEDHLLNLAAYWSALGMTSHACDIMSLYVDRFFPNNLDTDDRVIEAYLEGGRPELADAFIKRRFDELDLRPPPHNLPDKIPSDAPIRRYQDLDSKIRVCLERKARALRLADLAKEVIEDEPRQATRLLASAHELLPGDDDIRVNLAVALRSSDDAKSAFDHFLHASRTLDPPRSSACMANAAFCLFEQRQVAAGIELLHFAISEISDGEGRLKIADLPGVLGWVSGHTSMGNLGSAVRCLEHAVTICPHEHRRQLTALITLYRKAWEATSTRL